MRIKLAGIGFRALFLLLLLMGGSSHTVFAQAFVHPGGLHTLADLNRMKTNVLAGNHPWIDDWNVLITDSLAQSNVSIHATTDFNTSRQNADADAHAAYLNTIRWYISGDVNFANTATNILNKWSSTVTTNTETGGGLSGLPTMSFALVGELLRTYSGWKTADFTSFTNMMVRYLYPPCNNYVTSQPCNFAHWTSWDAPNNAAIIVIGVLCDDTNKYNQAVNFFKSGVGTGAISNAVPYLYSGLLGQCDESGRDQEHCTLGIADMGVLCQVAWNQGLDLFGFSNNRLLAGIEYVAQYNLWHNVPYTSFNDCANDNLFYVSDNGRGRIDDRPVYEMFYNHYAVLQGLSAPNTKAMAQLYRPERSSADHFGYGTLTFTLTISASPYPPAPLPAAPTGLTAQGGISQVTLNWTPSAGDLAQGYNVLRSTTSGGRYTSIATWTANTSPNYTDTSAVSGTTYYYVVSANNQSGTSANSAEVSATPTSSALLTGWTQQDIGVVTSTGSSVYAGAGDNTFIVTGYGTGIGGTGDGGFNYTYLNATNNFTIIARLTVNNADQMGLMMRASLAINAALVQFFMANNARQSIYGVRTGTGANLNHYNYGDQFTYPPAWYKLTRTGNTFTAYQSSDGVTWITVGSSTVTMPTNYYAGLAINNGSATFDNVVYTGNLVLPAAPTNVMATAVASNQVYLTWSAIANVVSSNVKRSIVSGSGYTLIASNIEATAYYDTTSSANTTYYYVVSAINGAGESVNSAQANATTPGSSAPAAPVGVIATPGAAQVVLNWAATIGASSYNVKRSTTSGGPYTNITTGVIATFTDTNVATGTRYYYVVSAVNGVGESPSSAEISTLVEATMRTYLKFDETSGTTATDSTGNGWNGTLMNSPTWVAGYSNNAVNLSSNSSQYVTVPAGVVNNLNNFSIAMWVKQTSVGNWARIFDFGTGQTVYMFLTARNGASSTLRFAITTGGGGGEQQINGPSALPTGVWKHVAVTLNGSVGILYLDGVAVGTNSSMTLKPSSLGSTTQNYIGKSQFSDPYFNGQVDDFRIYSDALNAGEVTTFITPLAAPTNLTATASNNLVALKWNSAARATSYNVMRSLTNGGTYSFVASVTTTNYTNTGLVNDGATYYYVVTAMNAVGQSTNSTQVSATLPAPPNSPAGLTATPGDAQVSLGWNAASGATNYFVKSALVPGGPYATIRTNGTSLSFTNTGLSNGTVYYYVVSASNSAGESTNSTEVSAQPASTSAPQLGFGVSSNQLQFTWPADHTGWRLQVQTNSLNTGLGTNWVTVPDSTSTNQMFVPMDPANGSVFFRLVYP
jgi:fibronectin type 3 domain-containing protein